MDRRVRVGGGIKNERELLKGDGEALYGAAGTNSDGKVIKVDGYALKGDGETLTGDGDGFNGDGIR